MNPIQLNYCYCCGAPQKPVLISLAFVNGNNGSNGHKPTPVVVPRPKKRGRPRNISPEESALMKKMREEGKGPTEIARELGRSDSAVHRALKS